MITIAGAGFSGLTLAYYLSKLGAEVQIFEKRAGAGGMIETSVTPLGLAESAANAFLNDVEIEKLFDDLQVPFAGRKPERKKRYIFWERPTRWPLSLITSARVLLLLGQVRMGSPEVMPRPFETIHEWSRRVANAEFEERLLSPALQGVFAGDPKRLSATLALGALFAGRAPAGKQRGSVSPVDGMGQLMTALRARLESKGVKFHFDRDFHLEDHRGPVALCTSAWQAAEITERLHPELSDQLRHCESLPLVSATAFFEKDDQDLQGFGCLFPVGQGFQAAGAVFNDCVFENRGPARSETWIFGGAMNPGAAGRSDEEIADIIKRERARLMPGNAAAMLDLKVSRWPRAIPHYTVQWEKFLLNLKVDRPLYLHGNYLGALGLSRIHRRSTELAKEIHGA